MSDHELIGLPSHEVMRIGPPVDVKDLIARDEAVLAELYKSTDYEDCYLDIDRFEAATASTNQWALSAFDSRREELFGLMVQSVERYLRTVPADYGVCPGYPTEPRHNRAHANKLARHAKRPNGRPRHR